MYLTGSNKVNINSHTVRRLSEPFIQTLKPHASGDKKLFTFQAPTIVLENGSHYKAS